MGHGGRLAGLTGVALTEECRCGKLSVVCAKVVALGSLAGRDEKAVRWFPAKPACKHVPDVPRQTRPPGSFGTKKGKLEWGLLAGRRPLEALAVSNAMDRARRDLAAYFARVQRFCLGEAPSGGDAPDLTPLVAQLHDWREFEVRLAEVRSGLARKHQRSTADAEIDHMRLLTDGMDRFLRQHYRAVPPVPEIDSVGSRLRMRVRWRHGGAVDEIRTYVTRVAHFYGVVAVGVEPDRLLARLVAHEDAPGLALERIATGLATMEEIRAEKLPASELTERLDSRLATVRAAIDASDGHMRRQAAQR